MDTEDHEAWARRSHGGRREAPSPSSTGRPLRGARQLYGLQPEFACLYRGELAPDMAEVAPYLVRLEPATEFADWVVSGGWGKHWGVFALAHATLREMRHHFRAFLTVYDPEGKPLLFRYYDPRVLRVYLPTCDARELETVFGPVAATFSKAKTPRAAPLRAVLRRAANGGRSRSRRAEEWKDVNRAERSALQRSAFSFQRANKGI